MNRTEELEHKIKNSEEVEVEFINSKRLLREQILKSNYSISNVNSELGMNNYLYEILDESNKKNYSRDSIIAVLALIQTDIDTAQRILQGFGHSKLYVRIPRDRIIFEGFCKNKVIWDIDNDLVKHDFDTIFKK